MRKIFILILLLVLIPSVYANYSISTSNNIRYSNDTRLSMVGVPASSYVIIKTITVNDNYTGSLRTYQEIELDSYVGTYCLIINVFGVNSTEECSSGSFDIGYTTHDFTFTNMPNGSVITWYAKKSSAGYAFIQNVRLLFDYSPISFSYLSPTNSSSVTNPVSISWEETPFDMGYTYQISTSSDFSLPILTTTYTPSLPISTVVLPSLSYNTYYWRVKNVTGVYNPYQVFTLTPAFVQGYLNLSVYDEVTELPILNYSVLIYNNTNSFTVNSNLISGYINLTNITGNSIYMVKVINSSYAIRYAILNSPNTIKIYIPPLTSTIDTVTFSQLDYTGDYPSSASYVVITKAGDKLISSGFWSAEATNTVYLIRDTDYTISVFSNDGLHSKVWGNYKAIGSTVANIAIMDLGVNSSQYVNYGYTTEWNTTGLTITWITTVGFLTNLFINIEDSTGINVYNINTSVASGSILINLPDTVNGSYVGYIEFNDPSNGHTFIHKYGKNAIPASQWGYGSFIMPDWFKNAISWFIVMLFGGSFVYIHRGIGAILTGIIIILLWYWDFLTISETFIGFIAGITILVIIYHLDSARRER
jgi:hypothetical protein